MTQFVVTRHDQDDGSITYEVWDHNPETYWRLASANDADDFDIDGEQSPYTAKASMELICKALNNLTHIPS